VSEWQITPKPACDADFVDLNRNRQQAPTRMEAKRQTLRQRSSEQILVLLLTLYQVGEAESVTAVCQLSTLLKRCVSTFFVTLDVHLPNQRS
jgi:hypothetical protein